MTLCAVVVERVGCLTYLDEANPNRVKNQTVSQFSPGEVAFDRSEGGSMSLSRCPSWRLTTG
jgi:hypothetical protein